MGVIDILPSCVTSVYFMWEKEYEKFSLGKVSRMVRKKLQSLSLWLSQLSALHEISLAKEFHDAGVPQLKHVYMGQGTARNPLRRWTLTVQWRRFLHSQLPEDEV